MDPKANLKEQLALAKRLIAMSEEGSDEVFFAESDVVRLSELVIALDEWQSKGGLSPYSNAVSA